jgi:hypothetical protein
MRVDHKVAVGLFMFSANSKDACHSTKKILKTMKYDRISDLSFFLATNKISRDEPSMVRI